MSTPAFRHSQFGRLLESADERHGGGSASVPRDQTSPPPPSPQILIVDDDAGTCETFQLALAREGFRVRTARCGAEGIDVALGQAVDLMLVDQALPDMLGMQMIRTLQCDGSIPPFVLVSAFLTTPITVEAMRLGAIDVMEKPISVDDLPTRVDSALRRRATVATSVVPSAGEQRRGAPATECSRQVEVGSAAERWAHYVIKGSYSTIDLKTVEQWAAWLRVSGTSLRESCRLVGVAPHDARDLMRMLRAIKLACLHECVPVGARYTLKGRQLASQARADAKKTKLPGEHNGLQDAYRHCLWSCRMTQELGATAAQRIGDEHENAGERAGQPGWEKAMDLANNAAGRACAGKTDRAGKRRDCADTCMETLRRGGLYGPGGIPFQVWTGPIFLR